jgi:hypothetical protein
VGPRAVLDAVVKRKIPSPRRESNPRTPIIQPVAQRYTAELLIVTHWEPESVLASVHGLDLHWERASCEWLW